MDLHGIVRGMITAVNPDVAGRLRVSTGYATAGDGSRTPSYAADRRVTVQVQDLSQRDVQHLDSLNVQGSQKVLYLRGDISGLVRARGKGNDLVVFDGGETWAVSAVIEQWPDWARVAVILQNGA